MAANILQRVEISLRSFYIFNSSYCHKEGEEYKKVLYYYPDDIELNTKIKDVGLSEAIIAFTSTFTDTENDCKALHTQKTTQLFYQPEPGYWLVLVVNVPKEIRTKDGVEVADYRGNEVHDGIYRNVLKQCFNMFRLLEGTFEMQISKAKAINNNNDAEESRKFLLSALKKFFDQHLSTLKMPLNDVIELTHSIQYLPLDKQLFLRAHNLTNTICATFDNIKDVIFLYKEQIICSGKVHPQDLYCLHEYIVDLNNENDAQGSMSSTSPSAETYRNGTFLIGGDSARSTPLIYLQNDNAKLVPYYLAVYRALDVTLCLLIEKNSELTVTQNKEFYADFHLNNGPHLNSLSSDISDMISQKTNANIKTTSGVSGGSKLLLSTTSTSNNAALHDLLSDANALTTPKYIFINEQSLKHLSNIPSAERRRRLPQSSKTLTASLPSNILHLMADLIDERTHKALNCKKCHVAASAAEEVQVKTTNDFWIVRRCCNWRQYYVIIFNSKATLLDITQEAKRIFEQELSDVVFFDD